MITGTCHCGGVRFELTETPEWLMRCTCSSCRRIAGLWAHAPASNISVTYAPGSVIRYVWGDKTLAFISCATCGATTHWESLRSTPQSRMAVNCNMCDPADIADLRIRTFDGADTWEYLD